ncbi:DNA-damage-inducible protein J [Oenococcus alcoholitolerans]|uniref:DNA-damage-inducible protein J n=1 Tax=Oenococcus alcoholitolerans TaxID=931074 RepID=A0ABR4XNV1_9LACO|nr:DNA-damage-inducible protein J [Oenococcus alcoholitolerans]
MAVKGKKRVQVQIDKDLANDTEAVLSELGLNPTTAINMFYKRIVANGALPFNVSLSQEERANLRFLRRLKIHQSLSLKTLKQLPIGSMIQMRTNDLLSLYVSFVETNGGKPPV